MKQFYAARGAFGAALGHRIARWKGRLLFLIVGTGFLLAGLSYFYSQIFQEHMSPHPYISASNRLARGSIETASDQS